MHIDSLSLYHVALPRKAPKIIAGRPCETLATVLVSLPAGARSAGAKRRRAMRRRAAADGRPVPLPCYAIGSARP